MDPLTWVALALMAAGTYTNYKATSKAQDAQRKAILEAQRRQTDLNRAAQGKTVEFAVDTYDPETRELAQEEAAQDATQSLLGEVLASRDRGMGETSDSGGTISEDYSTDRARMVAKTLDRASTLAQLIGQTRGPTDLRFNEGIGTARLGGDMADLAALGRSRAAADSGLIQIAGQVDPRMQAIGSLLSGVGTSMALGNVGKGSGGTTVGGTTMPKTMTSTAGQSGFYRIPNGTFGVPVR